MSFRVPWLSAASLSQGVSRPPASLAPPPAPPARPSPLLSRLCHGSMTTLVLHGAHTSDGLPRALLEGDGQAAAAASVLAFPSAEAAAAAAAATGGAVGGSGTLSEADHLVLVRPQRLLFFLLHAQRCTTPPDACPVPRCGAFGRPLVAHIHSCADACCAHPRCGSSARLLLHHSRCAPHARSLRAGAHSAAAHPPQLHQPSVPRLRSCAGCAGAAGPASARRERGGCGRDGRRNDGGGGGGGGLKPLPPSQGCCSPACVTHPPILACLLARSPSCGCAGHCPSTRMVSATRYVGHRPLFQAEKGAKATTELWPPNPKLLLMPTVTACFTFTFGHVHRDAGLLFSIGERETAQVLR